MHRRLWGEKSFNIRPVNGIESRFGYSPPLYHDFRLVSKLRGHNTQVLLRKNIISSFEDTEYKETLKLP
jgi:hypothetical protein